jgi:serine protease Do
VIGINSVKYVDSTVEGMGFSIPINDAMEIISGIISGNQKSDANIGIETVDIGREYSQIYDFPMGVYVKNVEQDSDAYKADLHTGDIIVEFGGEEVYTKKDLDSLIKKCEEGDTVEMEVYRADPMGNYEKIKVNLTLSAE